MNDDELLYRRSVAGSIPFVFACMTEPAHLAAFWGPVGTTTPLAGIVVELRPGGRFETLIVNNTDGSSHHMRAVFDEVDSPHTLSWTEPDSGMSTTITLAQTGMDRTEIRIHQRHVPDAMRGPGAGTGFQSSLDRFERYVHRAHRKDF